MKTHGIKGDDGREFAFEVDNFHLGRTGLYRLVSRMPGCVVLRKPKQFKWSSVAEKEFCEFELEGVRFVAWEPFGDFSLAKTVQPTGASRLAQGQTQSHRRLAPVADPQELPQRARHISSDWELELEWLESSAWTGTPHRAYRHVIDTNNMESLYVRYDR